MQTSTLVSTHSSNLLNKFHRKHNHKHNQWTSSPGTVRMETLNSRNRNSSKIKRTSSTFEAPNQDWGFLTVSLTTICQYNWLRSSSTQKMVWPDIISTRRQRKYFVNWREGDSSLHKLDENKWHWFNTTLMETSSLNGHIFFINYLTVV